jgi:hypothetical protein
MTSPSGQLATSNDIATAHFDFVDSRSYFKSPIATLVQSTDECDSHYISITDLLHAYNILSARIRLQIGIVSISNAPWSALTPIRQCSSQVVCAVRRDIRRILAQPSVFHDFGTSQPRGELSSDTTGADSSHRRTRERVELARHALRFLSDIFRFPVLHKIFTRMLSLIYVLPHHSCETQRMTSTTFSTMSSRLLTCHLSQRIIPAR